MNDDIIKDILKGLGLEGMPTEEGADLIDRIGTVAMDEIIEQATELLPETKQDEYLQLLDTNPTPDALFEFFSTNIPNFGEIVQSVMQEITQNLDQE